MSWPSPCCRISEKCSACSVTGKKPRLKNAWPSASPCFPAAKSAPACWPSRWATASADRPSPWPCYR